MSLTYDRSGEVSESSPGWVGLVELRTFMDENLLSCICLRLPFVGERMGLRVYSSWVELSLPCTEVGRLRREQFPQLPE